MVKTQIRKAERCIARTKTDVLISLNPIFPSGFVSCCLDYAGNTLLRERGEFVPTIGFDEIRLVTASHCEETVVFYEGP